MTDDELVRELRTMNINLTHAAADAIESLQAQVERLGAAAYAAYVESGEDTDGARDWRELFLPLKYPSWEEVVRRGVQRLRSEADESDADIESLQARIAELEANQAPHWFCTFCGYPWPAGEGDPNGVEWNHCSICNNDEWKEVNAND